MAESNFKIGVVGFGDWGRNIARTLAEMGVLGGLADHRPNSAALAFAAEQGITFQSLDDLLLTPHIHGICIAVQTYLHYSLAHKVLQAGKHVFVEKPMVYEIPEGESLINLAEKNGLTVMVGHLMLYHPAFQLLQQWVHQGKLGAIQQVITRRCNFGKIRLDENVIWDLAPHDLSMMLALMGGEPLDVSVHQGTKTVDALCDIATLDLTFPGGRYGNIFLSRLHPLKEQMVVVVGSKGMAVLDDTQPWDQKLWFDKRHAAWNDGILHMEPLGPMEYAPLPQGNPLKNEMAHFLECIEGKAPCISSGQNSLNILKILCNLSN